MGKYFAKVPTEKTYYAYAIRMRLACTFVRFVCQKLFQTAQQNHQNNFVQIYELLTRKHLSDWFWPHLFTPLKQFFVMCTFRLYILNENITKEFNELLN